MNTVANQQQNPQKEQQTAVLLSEEVAIEKPKDYHVILLNDDYTPMDFVIELLMVIFHKPFNEASDIMLLVHHQQRAVAGTYSREIAEEKMLQSNHTAAANGYPLTTIIEVA